MTDKTSAQADFISALLWLAFSLALIWGSWTMDRLEGQHINPYTAPGLVPGLLGLGIAVMGVLLLLRSMRAGGHHRAVAAVVPSQINRGRLWLGLALCLGYGALLVGRGLPFWLSTAIFVTAAIVLFQWSERRNRGGLRRGVAVALACGLGTAAAVTLVFQEIFLVRLP